MAPTVSLPGGVVNYTENDPPTVIDVTATVSDPDSANFDGGTLTVDFTASGTANDRLSIQDQGPGIPPKHLDLIWERFYRVEDSRDRDSGGMGLGLAIVKRLVEAQGGRVWAESRPGEGAGAARGPGSAPPRSAASSSRPT